MGVGEVAAADDVLGAEEGGSGVGPAGLAETALHRQHVKQRLPPPNPAQRAGRTDGGNSAL